MPDRGGANRVILVNPNTDTGITARMLNLARESAGGRFVIDALTAPFGSPLITDEAALAEAIEAVAALAPQLECRARAVIVAAFGDPGVEGLRRVLAVPVVGIGEAALREAARDARRFCVVTTTPDLAAAIDCRVHALGLASRYAGVVMTKGDAAAVTGSPKLLQAQLARAIERAVRDDAIEAVVIGGGPLAEAGRALVDRFPVVIVEPIGAAIAALRPLLEGSRPDGRISS
jgi:Asp/Glu/hydantoin racemase